MTPNGSGLALAGHFLFVSPEQKAKPALLLKIVLLPNSVGSRWNRCRTVNKKLNLRSVAPACAKPTVVCGLSPTT